METVDLKLVLLGAWSKECRSLLKREAVRTAQILNDVVAALTHAGKQPMETGLAEVTWSGAVVDEHIKGALTRALT